MKRIKVATMHQFIQLAHHADKARYNRRVNVETLSKMTNVVFFSMMHNDSEMRTMWYLKLRNQTDPVEVALDVSFEDFNRLPEMIIKHSEG